MLEPEKPKKGNDASSDTKVTEEGNSNGTVVEAQKLTVEIKKEVEQGEDDNSVLSQCHADKEFSTSEDETSQRHSYHDIHSPRSSIGENENKKDGHTSNPSKVAVREENKSKKLLKNRVAAKKSRQKKKETMEHLTSEHQELETANLSLAEQLKGYTTLLQSQIAEHSKSRAVLDELAIENAVLKSFFATMQLPSGVVQGVSSQISDLKQAIEKDALSQLLINSDLSQSMIQNTGSGQITSSSTTNSTNPDMSKIHTPEAKLLNALRTNPGTSSATGDAGLASILSQQRSLAGLETLMNQQISAAANLSSGAGSVGSSAPNVAVPTIILHQGQGAGTMKTPSQNNRDGYSDPQKATSEKLCNPSQTKKRKLSKEEEEEEGE
eukprot:CAMPEP_0115024966 /NCGR_PEP_ID=MMETSP0216-20121206/33654_1 /TAXON_ID=223996 /ORGANISM="Protocruzia adherens, Strain Boccale" /LENGTH=380 /DNA_ID=CAMNT_0002399329 /DNA_START=442 /DNA_END=1584 /DNA_ORIENTATION=-